MSIKITRPGMFTTIQDLGRNGYRAVGIGPGGAMDTFAACVANLLINQDEKSPVIEMHFPAAEMLFEEDALVSITGGDFNAYIDDEPIALWRPIVIKKDQRLSFKKYSYGARAYLAIYGAFVADNWLNSFSTHTKIQAGGYKGRPLKKDDILFINSPAGRNGLDNFPDIVPLIKPVYHTPDIIRCVAGPEWELLNDESKAIFNDALFSVTPQSDRMGYRLKGADLRPQQQTELVSSPVDYGTVQLLPNGQLIVLMADHQTTGGYPRIATVAAADLPKLAQCPANSIFNFVLIDIEEAEQTLVSLYRLLESIKNSCTNYYDANRY